MCLKLRTIRDFLSFHECESLIFKYSGLELEKSKTTSPGSPKATSQTSSQNKKLDKSDLHRLKDKLSNKLDWSYQAIEDPHFIRYQVGDEYKPHYDDFPPIMFYMKSIAERNQLERHGNRIATAILYLNENFEGGETEFLLANHRIKPETGLLSHWNNVNEEGMRIEKALHAGSEVIAGTKYIIGFHLREKY